MEDIIFRMQKPFIFTIFGGSGDLAKLKIFPALFALAEQKRLPKDYAIIGYSRSEYTHEAFRDRFTQAVKDKYEGQWEAYQEDILNELLGHIYYHAGKYDQDEDFQSYGAFRDTLLKDYDQEIFYFSTPPQVFVPIIKALATVSGKEKMKLVLEKPFGANEDSAKEMFHIIGERFKEDQIYLLDHYLGKKPVRGLLPLRYNNALLNLALKGHCIDSIQISALEPFGVEDRLGYFDQVGTIRDMIQSHLLQILSFAIMNMPARRSSSNIRREKNNILEALHIDPSEDSISIGQYEGYCEQNKEVCHLGTPTFAAIKLSLDHQEWADTSILLRSGKYIGEKKNTYIVIDLKKQNFQKADLPSNKIIIELSPNEVVHVRLVDDLGVERSGEEIASASSIACEGDYCLTEHGILLLDVLRDKKENFLSFGEILSCWAIVDEVIEFTDKSIPERYAQGSGGPSGQQKLVDSAKTQWYDL